MTHIRNHRWLALLACVAMLSLVFGCHSGGSGDGILALLMGCWDGNVITLLVSALVLVLTGVYLAFPETDTSAVGTPTVGQVAELTAHVDGEYIHYVGTVVEVGNELVVNLVPYGVSGTQVGVDTMTLTLQGDTVKQEMSGTMTWFKDGEEFTGPANFERYPPAP